MTLQFVIPWMVLIFTYTQIAIAVWGKRPPGEAENLRDQRMARSKRKVSGNLLTLPLFVNLWKLWKNIDYLWGQKSWKLLRRFRLKRRWIKLDWGKCWVLGGNVHWITSVNWLHSSVGSSVVVGVKGKGVSGDKLLNQELEFSKNLLVLVHSKLKLVWSGVRICNYKISSCSWWNGTGIGNVQIGHWKWKEPIISSSV